MAILLLNVEMSLSLPQDRKKNFKPEDLAAKRPKL